MLRLALASVFSTALMLAFFLEGDAAACGGCFTTPPPPNQTASDITDERMLLSLSPTQTTLYDQISYAGNPASFAWVLPTHGPVTVALSADVLFDSIDALTATTIVPPPQPACPTPTGCNQAGGCGLTSSESASSFAGGASAEDGGAMVTVTKQQNVGPYETVQLQSTDATALEDWLGQNGFDVPADVQPVIDAYVTEGFDFLAMKLLPGEGVQSMRPVRVTMPGASFALPLRMAAVGTGATVGITIWVVSDGRYEPQNFPFFHIEDSELVWDWSTSLSNYTTLRTQHEAALGGKGWEIESSLALNEQLVDGVILSGGQYSAAGGVPSGPPSDASEDYLPVEGGDAGEDGGITMTADQVREADMTTLFVGMSGPNVRITRMRSDISHAAMTTDFVLQASADQSELSNVRDVTNGINEQCPIYDGCNVIGTGTLAQAQVSVAFGGGGGCVAAPKRGGDGRLRLALLASAIGLAVVRLVRDRQRRTRTGS
jgi:hypothetical protein